MNTTLTHPVDAFLNEQTPSRVRARYRALSEIAKTDDFGNLDADVVVIDTETTGVSYKSDELTQIAAARMVKGRITEWFVTFVNPGKPIPEEIQHLTNIHHADVADAPTPEEAVQKLVEFVGSSDLVAHNAGFDRYFITKHEAGAPLKANAWIDSLDLARVALPRLRGHRLIDLVHAFGTKESTHRADDDVAATCQVYRVLLAAVKQMPADLIHVIAGFATIEEWPTVKVFQYFDDLNTEANGGKVDVFNLKSMRYNRVKSLRMPGKVDAAQIADPYFESPEGAPDTLQFPSNEVIEAAFDATGMVGSAYDDYEARAEQIEMSQAVLQAFARSRNLVVEAGTGVGKSMAYLVPAVLAAKESKITVGIATKSNNLLDQLVNKELPLLNNALADKGGVSFVPLKGFSHYPCLLRIERLLREGPKFVEATGQQLHQAPALAALLSFIEQSDYDDMDGLKIDYRRVPRYSVCSTSHECLRRKCPYFGTSCFVHGARLQAQSADVVVTNHSMLFCDLQADGGLLPPIRYWVVDEAHGAEEEGRRAFSVEVSSEDLQRIATKVASEKPSQNVFLRVERRFGADANPQEIQPGNTGTGGEATATLYGLSAKARSAGVHFAQAVHFYCMHVKDLLYYEPRTGANKGYERIELWVNDEIRHGSIFMQLVDHAKVLTNSVEQLITASQELVAWLEGLEGAAALQREIAATTLELKELLGACETVFFSPTPLYAYSAELSKTRDRFNDKLCAQMMNIGEHLNETLFANTFSIVFTSATIAVDGSFDVFERAMGLNSSEKSQADYLQLDSSYDFDENMTIYVPTDMPEPTEPSYLSKLQKLLVAVHKAQGGSTLTLFTNRREMESCFKVVQPALAADEIRVVCQRKGVSVKNLRDEFVKDEHLSLMALKSFWEGFDAPGDTLRTVVIPKLPFKKPSDPLSCERQQNDSRAWAHYVLPDAIIETKQAAGRLIRNANDSGSLVLADHRLVSKGYGKKFLNSMPSKNIKLMTIAQIARDIEERAK
ncbi:MAG: helicase C-terminal domain-containing protein [Coriobacteriia bacterium]|nr:helicase C-terminal domain-containing protein [Coriobacteriia bacterium]